MRPSFHGMIAARCKTKAVSRCCGLLLLLKAYQLDHGHLPATLDALVPDYLAQVPADPFDGKPMRYSAERKIVYSVGENLTDEAGKETVPQMQDDGYGTRRNPPDIVFHADF